MKQIPCSMIRDILPNFIDGLTEEETNNLIVKHLTECEECNKIYNEMKSEVEFKTIKKEAKKSDQVREFFRQAKLGYVVKKIYHILRVLILLLYAGINVFVLYTSISKVTYFTLFERVTTLNMLLLLSITLLVPGILILILFMKKDSFVLNIAKGIIQILLLVIIPYILILGLLIGLRTPSYTTNNKNYGVYDREVEELLSKQEFIVLPRRLPDNISDVNYIYKYEAIFDDQYLDFHVSWTYNNKKDFEQAKIKMITQNKDKNEKLENSEHSFYSFGSSAEDKNYFQYGYDDTARSVSYKINYEWK